LLSNSTKPLVRVLFLIQTSYFEFSVWDFLSYLYEDARIHLFYNKGLLYNILDWFGAFSWRIIL